MPYTMGFETTSGSGGWVDNADSGARPSLPIAHTTSPIFTNIHTLATPFHVH